MYIAIELADSAGIVESMASDRLSITISGAAELAGFGSADPASTDAFTGTECATYFGRAQAILRGTAGTDAVTVTVRSGQHGEAHLTFTVNSAP